MSAYEPPPPPEARGLRLGDLVRRRHLADPDDEEPAFPPPREERVSEPGRGSSRGTRAPRQDDEPSWRRDLRERRKHERDAAEARRTTERASGSGARPGRADERRADAARSADAQRSERGPGAADPPTRPTVRHVMKPRDPGRHNAPATPVESARKLPWRKPAKATGSGAGAAGAGAAADAASTSAGASGLARFVRKGPAAGAGDDSTGPADSGTQGGSSGIPKVPAPFAGGTDGSTGSSFGPFTGTDLAMLIPAGFAAYYGAGLLVSCSSEAGFMAAFCLWLMMGFWIVIVSAKWPLMRLMRWAWVLAGLMAGASIPIGGG
ncbi:hypothetical protein ACIRL2_49720 [Embleya sp. NPDC127516]|uniref:hypothetical protein n=1 Tax=Embleya sp. NPDC127516 TaxID=3363990 RepID=UPI00382423C2